MPAAISVNAAPPHAKITRTIETQNLADDQARRLASVGICGATSRRETPRMMNRMQRTGGRILVDQLELHGVRHAFCVPGESYLEVLDALRDSRIALTVCRQEGGAAMMAEAAGKLSGVPGVCLVTRAPGATNASPGLHIAMHDSTPMLLLVGQVERSARGREAFQELDYRAFFGGAVKWVTEIDDARRIPELISRAFH